MLIEPAAAATAAAAAKALPKRILHVVPGLPIGGAERMLEDVLRGVDSRFASHTIFNLQHGGPMQAALEAAGGRVVSGHMQAGRQMGQALARLSQLVAQFDPDIVHGWMYAGNLAARLGCGFSRRPRPPQLVWSIHSAAPFWPHMGFRRLATNAANRWLSDQPGALLYVAQASAEAHTQAGFAQARAQVIAGGVDTERFAPNAQAARLLRARLGLAADVPLVGMVARLHPMKRHDVFLQAASRLAADQEARGKAARLGAERPPPNCHFVLVGADLSQLPRALQPFVSPALKSRLHTLGAQSDMAALVQGLDVMCLSSDQEALPKALLEAMACAVLCVATCAGDVPQLLRGAGWVVPTGCPKALARALCQALACPPDEARARQALGRNRILARFGHMHFAAAMTALYQNLPAPQKRSEAKRQNGPLPSRCCKF